MSKQNRDTLYQVEQVEEDFIFNERVVEVFDDMLDRSIPFYDEVIDCMAGLLGGLLTEGDRVVDLGCATGTCLIRLAAALKDKPLSFVGVDNSPAMLHKATLKAELLGQSDRVRFIEEDITRIDLPGSSAILLNYTLQFIRPMKRQEFINHLHDQLRPGGVLLLSEKQISHDSLLNRKFIDIYHGFKKERGYSELEIAKKREALENILIPFSIEENRKMLTDAGFKSVETFFQWFNFASFVAVKS
ncbi:MAG: carboxy-S-adenosyl-L-methionine synthase CmoA [Thermodesulfobacteriota bacterium]